MKILIFAKQLLLPPRSCAYGTCLACHTLDTPLTKMFKILDKATPLQIILILTGSG